MYRTTMKPTDMQKLKKNIFNGLQSIRCFARNAELAIINDVHTTCHKLNPMRRNLTLQVLKTQHINALLSTTETSTHHSIKKPDRNGDCD